MPFTFCTYHRESGFVDSFIFLMKDCGQRLFVEHCFFQENVSLWVQVRK